MDPIYCQVKFSCNDTSGAAKARFFCRTEGKYVCVDDNEYCHQKAHNWRELKDSEKGGIYEN